MVGRRVGTCKLKTSAIDLEVVGYCCRCTNRTNLFSIKNVGNRESTAIDDGATCIVIILELHHELTISFLHQVASARDSTIAIKGIGIIGVYYYPILNHLSIKLNGLCSSIVVEDNLVVLYERCSSTIKGEVR